MYLTYFKLFHTNISKQIQNLKFEQKNRSQKCIRKANEPTRMATIKTTTTETHTESKHWQGCREIGTFVHYWWEFKMVQQLWETVSQLFKELKIELLYDRTILLLGIYLKKLQSGS